MADDDAGTASEDAGAVAASEPSCPASSGIEGNTVDLPRLLSELVDLAALTRLPVPAYESRFVSSHDRRSDGATPGSSRWFANHDYLVLDDDGVSTLLDVDGPGVLTRLWSASPEGTLRIFIDGSTRPTVQAPLKDLLSGEVPPFSEPFAFVAAGGHNLYFPIPFATHIRVTLTGPAENVFYHVAYRAYGADATVRSFGPAEVERSECERALVADRLSRLQPDTDAIDSARLERFELDSGATTFAEIAADAEGSMLWQLRLWPNTRDAGVLRSTLLSIELDGEETVHVPLGDFFASGVANGVVNSVPAGATKQRPLTARWPMPFRSTARISLRAMGDAGAGFVLETATTPEPWTERSLRFHASWHAPETFPSKPSHDWNLTTIEGTGLYVGNVLNVVNPSDAWWGEGDEKIYVDGEALPGHFGTGTEDYYGYAWCANKRFTAPYVGQPLSAAWRSFGRMTLYRFHILDALAFRSALRFDMEVRHWGDPVEVTYDATSYWYALPGSRSLTRPPRPADFRVPELTSDLPDDADPAPYRCEP